MAASELSDFMPYVVLVVVGCGLLAAMRIRGKARLREWAETNNLTILDMKWRYLSHGPFFWVLNTHTVFRITVQDANGEIRKGWVRIGGLFSGGFSVKWDSEVGPVRMTAAIPIGIILLGVTIVAVGGPSLWKAVRKANWPTTRGTVVFSQVRQVERDHGKAFAAKIRFEYTVAGANYRGEHRSWAYRTEAQALERLAGRAKGTKVEVHYNPTNPWETALFPWETTEGHKACVAGAVLLAIGIGLAILRARKRSDVEADAARGELGDEVTLRGQRKAGGQ